MATSSVPAAACPPNAVKGHRLKRSRLRIGVYVGAFNPVHAGHIAFALEAIRVAGLDQVVFLPERHPYGAVSLEHYAHRVAMLKTALAPHGRLAVLEVVDSRFSLLRTLPQIRRLFPHATTVFLSGADAITDMAAWPYAQRVLSTAELVLRLQSSGQQAEVERRVRQLGIRPQQTYFTAGYAADVSSRAVRQAIRSGGYTPGLLASVQRYAKREWLYVSPGYHVS